MNASDVNVTLLMSVILTGSFSLAVWFSPRAMNWIGKRLLARAFALQRARAEYTKAYREQMAP